MTPFEALSEQDKNNIASYIRENAYMTSTTTPAAPLENILKEWNTCKQNLFHVFGDHLIIERQVSFERAPDQIEEDLLDSKIYNEFRIRFKNILGQQLKNNIWEVLDLLTTENLVNNTYNGLSFTITLPDGKELMIQNGCKTSKMVGKICKAFNVPGYEEWRINISQILNQKKLSGHLSLSIHPLDYMTMSDNDCGWDSCMSWVNEGDYRRGTVEMMNSPGVIVAYLTADTPFYRGSVTWNNKKWRKLFILTPEFITGIKGYPYENDNLTKTVLAMLKDLSTASGYGDYLSQIYRYPYNEYFSVEDNNEIKCNFFSDAMYNDFGGMHYGYFGKDVKGRIDYNFSGRASCMHCGSVEGWYAETNVLICDSCAHLERCSCCGNVLDDSDDYYEIDGEIICYYCYDDHSTECALSGDSTLDYNCYKIYFAKDDKIDTSRFIYVASKHFNNNDNPPMVNDQYKPIWDKLFKVDKFHIFCNYWEEYYYITDQELTEDGMRIFDFGSEKEMRDYSMHRFSTISLN